MSKWCVLVIYDASATVEVEAETQEEAMEKAMNEAGPISICNQCNDEIEIGDAIKAVEAWEAEAN